MENDASQDGPPSPDGPEAGTAALDRLVFFSDAVFAIAMTLLVLAIPRPGSDVAIRYLWRDYHGKFVAYFIGFWVIALYWLAHHRLFRLVTRYDTGVLVLNLALLFCIAFLPYPTAVLGDHGDTVAGTVFYAICVAITGAFSTLLGWYVIFRRRYTVPISPLLARYHVFRGAVVPMFFLLSIPVVLITRNAYLGEAIWLLIFVAQVAAARYVAKRRAPASSTA
ncbi:MAG TPA: TMEM175 family protein [Actinomycetota bacterium]|nr:TMEM175 family protein [Actinomycetota bacterium]